MRFTAPLIAASASLWIGYVLGKGGGGQVWIGRAGRRWRETQKTLGRGRPYTRWGLRVSTRRGRAGICVPGGMVGSAAGRPHRHHQDGPQFTLRPPVGGFNDVVSTRSVAAAGCAGTPLGGRVAERLSNKRIVTNWLPEVEGQAFRRRRHKTFAVPVWPPSAERQDLGPRFPLLLHTATL